MIHYVLCTFSKWWKKTVLLPGEENLLLRHKECLILLKRKFLHPFPLIPIYRALKVQPFMKFFLHFYPRRLMALCKCLEKKMKGYLTNEALLVATESRTSSPVRIPRNAGTLQHPQISNLYPCGEGAGYAGGIVSAAMDGERVANAVINSL